MCGIGAPGWTLLKHVHIEGGEGGKELGRLRSEKLLGRRTDSRDQITGGEEKREEMTVSCVRRGWLPWSLRHGEAPGTRTMCSGRGDEIGEEKSGPSAAAGGPHKGKRGEEHRLKPMLPGESGSDDVFADGVHD